MADATIVIGADLKEVTKGLKTLQGFERQLDNVTKAVLDGKLSQDAYKKALTELGRVLTSISTSHQKAHSDTKRLAASMLASEKAARAETEAKKAQTKAVKELRTALATQKKEEKAAAVEANKHAKELQNVLNSINPLGAAVQAHNRKLEVLNREFAKTNPTEYARQLGFLRQQAQRAGIALDSTGRATGQFNKNSRHMQLQIQQAGYQIGDFFTQVQMGANPMMAFSTQASQLAGFFSGPWGAAIGAGISIVGALAIAFMNSREEIKETKEQLDDFNSSIETYIDLVGRQRGKNTLIEEFGDMADEAERALSKIKEYEEFKITKQLSTLLTPRKVTSVTSYGSGGATEVYDPALLKAAEEITGLKRITQTDLLKEYLELVKELQNAETDTARIDAAQELSDFLSQHVDKQSMSIEQAEKLVLLEETLLKLIETRVAKAGGASGLYYDEFAGSMQLVRDQFARTTTFANEQVDEFAGIMEHMQDRLESAKPSDIMVGTFDNQQVDEFAGIMEHINDLDQERLDKAAKLKVAYDEMYAKQALRTNFAEAIVGLDEKSAKYKNLEYQLEMNLLRLDMKKAGYTETQIESYIELLRQQEVFTQDAEAAADQSERLTEALKEAAKAMADLSNFSSGLDEKIAVAKAQVEALKSGADAAVAGQIAGLKFDLGQMAAADIAAGRSPDEVAAKYAGEYGKISTLENLLTQKGTLSSTGKGSKATKETVEERLGALIKTAAFERTLIGVEEERATQLRRTQELTDMVRDSEGNLTDKRLEMIDQIVEMEAATRKLTEAENYRENQIQSFSNKMETALMSIVDGSATVEDAFKSMLRGILLEIYQQQVAKPVANFFGNMLFGGANANGNAFLGGNVIPFANGGVVGSPTFFPMANGMGLMGEAGPEAIMPLKRGSDGKLGVAGGGQTVINQTINVSTGVQQTVRNEIKTLMPQIAEQSKNAVLDAKRRGGSYGKRFA